MKKENDKIPAFCMLPSPALAIFESALFTCTVRSDWLLRVPRRLICEGKEACVEKDYRPRLFPLYICETKKKKK